MNFTKFIYDLFDEQANTTTYDPNGTHTFDQTSNLWVFHTREVFSAEIGRMYFYFDQATGDLKWMYFENNKEIMRINKGMEQFIFSDEDFNINCKPDATLNQLKQDKTSSSLNTRTKRFTEKLLKLANA